MTALPPGWLRSVCPKCGREVVLAPIGDGDHVRLDPSPRRLFVADDMDGEAALTDCYTPHAMTCDYRGPA